MNAKKKEDMGLIAMDRQNQRYLLGSDIRSAKFQGSDGSGTASTKDGRRGLGLQFAFQNHILHTNTVSVPLTGAVPAP